MRDGKGGRAGKGQTITAITQIAQRQIQRQILCECKQKYNGSLVEIFRIMMRAGKGVRAVERARQ